MREWLLELLECPACRRGPALTLEVEWRMDEEIIDGMLRCPCCGAHFPVRSGVPRFVKPEQDYCENFGFQWRRWKAVQIDRLAGHTLSHDGLLSDTGWSADWLKGKVILDCGCGAGRYADIAAQLGAKVVAIDISQAVDACYENTACWNGAVQPIQASLFDLPLRQCAFDGLYCIGVIQHTPDPKALMRQLPAWLRAGGRLTYNFYEANFWPKLQPIKYALRLVTPHIPTGMLLTMCEALVTILFPISRMWAHIPKIRILNHALPISTVHHPSLTVEQQLALTLLDTFDWYSPRYEKRQRHVEVGDILAGMGLSEIMTRPGIARAKR